MNTPKTVGIDPVIIWTEKKKGKGEDGPPLLMLAQNDGQEYGLAAVADGVGGAGARQIKLSDGEEIISATHARIGSHLATLCLANLFLKISADTDLFYGDVVDLDSVVESVKREELEPNLVNLDDLYIEPEWRYSSVKKLLIEKLDTELSQAFKAVDSHFAAGSSKFNTKMYKNYPTTIAGVIFSKVSIEESPFSVLAFWSGDSRCFLLDSAGLKQLSIDDADKGDDALYSMQNDPKMSKYVTSSYDVNVNFREYELVDKRAMIIVATDGAFNYFRTPMHFEYYLLNCLYTSKSLEEFKVKLTSIVQDVTGDDVSFVLIPIGFSSFEEVRNYIENRYREMAGFNRSFNNQMEYLTPLIEDEKRAKEELETAAKILMDEEKRLNDFVKEYWHKYREAYCERISKQE